MSYSREYSWHLSSWMPIETKKAEGKLARGCKILGRLALTSVALMNSMTRAPVLWNNVESVSSGAGLAFNLYVHFYRYFYPWAYSSSMLCLMVDSDLRCQESLENL